MLLSLTANTFETHCIYHRIITFENGTIQFTGIAEMKEFDLNEAYIKTSSGESNINHNESHQ